MAGATVLISGSGERVGPVAEAFERRRFGTVRVVEPDDLLEAAADLEPKTLDAYVQLPVETSTSGATAVTRIREFLTQGLLFRYDATAAVLPALADGACVAFVSGNLPGDLTAPDDQRARLSLLRVLAHAVLADTAGRGVRAVVLDHQRAPEEIVTAVVEAPADRVRMVAEFVEHTPDMSYDDWRLELLRLASIES
jgi:hypothetical protein